MPTKRRKRRSVPAVKGLRFRRGLAYWERTHNKLGGRVVKSLETREPELAQTYASALNTLCDRGDWSAVLRWKRDELHITDIARAVREGDFGRLKRMSESGPLLGDAARAFLEATKAGEVKGTFITYTSALVALEARFQSPYPMAVLDTPTAAAFLYEPKETNGGEPWSLNTQRNMRTIYKAVWSKAIETEREQAEKADAVPALTHNPWAKVKVGKPRSTRHAFLSQEQWAGLREKLVGTPSLALLAIACLAGLRQQEVAHLRTAEDVDLDANLIHVVNRKGEYGWQTKHDHSQRDVPIVPELRELLEDHIVSGFAGRFFIHAPSRDRPLSTSACRDWTMEAFGNAGLRYGREGDALTLHSLRHTFGSWLASEGVPFHVIAELMGNTAQTAMSYYFHLAPHDKARAMEVISRMARA